jgi:hypothetical protein
MSTPTKKKTVKTTSTNAARSGVHPVPTGLVRPPSGWIEPERVGRKGRHAVSAQVQITPELADELRSNAEAFVAELGAMAPDPHQMADAFELAHGWGGVVDDSAAFHTYARVQKTAAWDDALTFLQRVSPGVRYAIQRNSTFAERFPVLTKMVANNRRGGRKGKGTTATATPAEPTPAAAPANDAAPANQAAPAVAEKVATPHVAAG